MELASVDPNVPPLIFNSPGGDRLPPVRDVAHGIAR
jgi:hypothetical protein